MNTLVLIAKEPIEGKVKTRLCPPLNFTQAASLAREALRDTVREISRIPGITKILYLEGEKVDFIPDDFEIIKQATGDLSERLAYVFTQINNDSPCSIIAMDTPQFKYSMLEVIDYEKFDCAIGLTKDGGYWVIAFKNPALATGVFENIEMSTANTGRNQLLRLEELGLKVQMLNTITDFDDIETALELATEFPNLDFSKSFSNVMNEMNHSE